MDNKERLSQFKNRGSLKQDELRRRREDVAVEIRKQKREEALAKRRNLVNVSSALSDDEDDTQAPAIAAQVCL